VFTCATIAIAAAERRMNAAVLGEGWRLESKVGRKGRYIGKLKNAVAAVK